MIPSRLPFLFPALRPPLVYPVRFTRGLKCLVGNAAVLHRHGCQGPYCVNQYSSTSDWHIAGIPKRGSIVWCPDTFLAVQPVLCDSDDSKLHNV
jgi:hypothetical protein